MRVATITHRYPLDETALYPANTDTVLEIIITEGDTEEDINTGFEFSERKEWKDDKFSYVSYNEEIIHAVEHYRDMACLQTGHSEQNNNYGMKSYTVTADDYIKKLHDKLPEFMPGVTAGGSCDRLKRYHSQYVSGMAVSLLAYNDDHAALKSEKIFGVPPSMLYDASMNPCSGYY